MKSQIASAVLTGVLAVLVFVNTKTVAGLEASIGNLSATVELRGSLDKNMLTTTWKSADGTQSIQTDISEFPTFEEAAIEHDRRVALRKVKHPQLP